MGFLRIFSLRSWDGGLAVVPSSNASTHDVQVKKGKLSSCVFRPTSKCFTNWSPLKSWAVLSDEQMSKTWPFSLLNNEQMSNWLGVEHQPERDMVCLKGSFHLTSSSFQGDMLGFFSRM